MNYKKIMAILACGIIIAGCSKKEDPRKPDVDPAPQQIEKGIDTGEEQSNPADKASDMTKEAEATMRGFLKAMQDEDINTYNDLITEGHKMETSEQIQLMFNEYQFQYDIMDVRVESANNEAAEVIAQYSTKLKEGDPNSFSENESTVKYKLKFENGKYKIDSFEVIDLKYFDE